MLTDSGHAKTLEYDSRAPSISAADGLGSKFDGQSRPIAVIAPGRQNYLNVDSCSFVRRADSSDDIATAARH